MSKYRLTLVIKLLLLRWPRLEIGSVVLHFCVNVVGISIGEKRKMAAGVSVMVCNECAYGKRAGRKYKRYSRSEKGTKLPIKQVSVTAVVTDDRRAKAYIHFAGFTLVSWY